MAADVYIATDNIYVGTALAHVPGDEVPAENVERHGWQDKVSRPGTKSAKRAQDDTPTS